MPDTDETAAAAAGQDEDQGETTVLTGEDDAQAKDTQVDEKLADAFKDVAHEVGLTNKQAQGIAKGYERYARLAAQRAEELEAEKLAEAREYWAAECQKMPDFKGKLADAKKALAAYGDKELIGLLNKSLLGSHPKVIEFFARVGKNVKEPAIRASGQGGAEGAVDPAKLLYPNM